MAGNAGKGRPPGSRNKRTEQMAALADQGETPVGFCLRLLNDPDTTAEIKLQAARTAAPFVHSRPQPAPRLVAFTVPDQLQTGDLVMVHETLIRATAMGEIAIEDARDLSAVIETHRRLIETVELEERINALEKTAR